MKVKAKGNIKYGQIWHTAGEIFSIAEKDWESVQHTAERVWEEQPAPAAPAAENPEKENEPRRTTRPRQKTRE